MTRVEIEANLVRIVGVTETPIVRLPDGWPCAATWVQSQGMDGAQVAAAGGEAGHPGAVWTEILRRTGTPAQFAWAAAWVGAMVPGLPEGEVELVGPLADLSLPWELLGPRHTFVRRLPGALAVSARVLPLRVLFVSGVERNDPDVTALAEFTTLYRRLELAEGTVLFEVLPQASLEGLREAVARERPDVVHIASHGRIEAKGAQLELRPSVDGGNAWFGAADVAAALTETVDGETRPVPRLVVLNACLTAGSPESYAVSHPLAAALVEAGVPMAVGMAGKAADGFCRVFAHALLAGLVRGLPAGESVAVARAEARLHGMVAADAMDWVLPQLYARPIVGGDFVGADAVAAGRKVAATLGGGKPRFAIGRDSVWAAFAQLLTRPDAGVCILRGAARREEQTGRTFLIKNMFRRAWGMGHLPVLLPFDPQGDLGALMNVEVATDLRRFADQARASMRCSAEALAKAANSAALHAAAGQVGARLSGVAGALAAGDATQLGAVFGQFLEADEARTLGDASQAQQVGWALAEDLADLQASLRNVAGWEGGRVLLLVDDVEKLGATLEALIAALKRPKVATVLSVAVAVGGSTGGAATDALISNLVADARFHFEDVKRWVPSRRKLACVQLLAVEQSPAGDGLALAPGRADEVHRALSKALAPDVPEDERAEVEIAPVRVQVYWQPLWDAVALLRDQKALLPLTHRDAVVLKGGG